MIVQQSHQKLVALLLLQCYHTAIMDIERIIIGIDEGLDEARPIYLQHDQLMAIEDEVWLELHNSVEGGWRSEDEAIEVFILWRERYRDIGRQAISASQTAGILSQQRNDNKRRMRRC